MLDVIHMSSTAVTEIAEGVSTYFCVYSVCIHRSSSVHIQYVDTTACMHILIYGQIHTCTGASPVCQSIELPAGSGNRNITPPRHRCHSVKGCNQSFRLTALSMLVMEDRGAGGRTDQLSRQHLSRNLINKPISSLRNQPDKYVQPALV